MATPKGTPVLRYPSKIILWESNRNAAPCGPVSIRRLRFELTDSENCFCLSQRYTVLQNPVGCERIVEPFSDEPFLPNEFSVNQFPGESYGDSRWVSKGLRTAQPRIGWSDRTSSSEHGTVPLKHDKCGVLISQPA